MRTNMRWIGPALAALVAVTGCAPTPGSPAPGEVAGTGTVTGTGTVGGVEEGGGGGTPTDDGPWAVVLNAGTVKMDKGRKFCGGPSPVMVGTATVSVANGPVAVTVVWRPAGGGAAYDESTIEFNGTGPQTKQVSAKWSRSWGTSGTVRISYADLVPGPGQQASQYIPPTPLDIDYQVPNCDKPDLSVKIAAVQVPPQKCPVVQATAILQVTLNSELSSDTGGFGFELAWSHPHTGADQSKELSFAPGGPKVLSVPVVFAGLLAPRPYEAQAHVRVERPGAPHNPYRYFAPEKPFGTVCVN